MSASKSSDQPSAHASVKARLQETIGYRFKDPSLLHRALTHASADDSPRERADNERLEFLGDRVLGLVIADMLIREFPSAPEGDLAPRLNALVRRETCGEVARQIGLGEALVLAPGEARGGGRKKTNILGDACEALLAALYLDGGIEAARTVIAKFWGPRLAKVEIVPIDAKTKLQEWTQARRLGTPVYEIASRSGPDHAPTFVVEVRIEGYDPQSGSGKSKREAEQAAAAAMMKTLGEDGA